jgi:hypothetical protein
MQTNNSVLIHFPNRRRGLSGPAPSNTAVTL